MPPKKLYEIDPNKMPFGVVPGSHIPHMFDSKPEKIKGFVKIKRGEGAEIKSGYDTVGQKELFSNNSEFMTEEAFRQLAIQSEIDYFAYADNDKYMDKFLHGIKNYITAGGRSAQQKALINLKISMHNCLKKYSEQLDEYSKKGTLSAKDEEAAADITKRRNAIMFYSNQLIAKTRGNLEIPDAKKVDPKTIKEPDNVFLGKIGYWEQSNDALFPHDPSPNDIKQGAGLKDCFALSVLIQQADIDPEYIKNMMRDNGNGTVSVRFFVEKPKKKGEEKAPTVKEPVYITVNKTVRKYPTGQDIYASSSLWVQMMEKAFAQYTEQYGAMYRNDKAGMGAIWENESAVFMNAIYEGEYTGITLPSPYEAKLYVKNDQGEFINHPAGYLPDEEAVFNGLKKYVNNKKQPITAMPDTRFLATGKNPHDEGIRNSHIYSIRKVFEHNGKKFVQLRDPYACFNPKYNGTKLSYNKEDIIVGTLKGGMDTMGTFNLELTDFMRQFSQLTGLSKEASDEFARITEKSRDYNMIPLSKAERTSVDEFNQAFKATQKEVEDIYKFRKSSATALAKKYFGNTDSMKAFSAQISEVVSDIKSTDEFFVWTNTASFKEMRDNLYALDKAVKNHLSGKETMSADKFADALNQLYMDSSNYINHKELNILEDISKDKSISDRAFLRYAAAINLNSIVAFEEPPIKWPGKSIDARNILKADIETQRETIANDIEKHGKTPELVNKLERLEKVGDLMEMDQANKEGDRSIQQAVSGKNL